MGPHKTHPARCRAPPHVSRGRYAPFTIQTALCPSEGAGGGYSSAPAPSVAFEEALVRARRGSGSVLVLTGGSRRWRSSLLRSTREKAGEAGFATVELHPDPVDRRVPFGVVQDLLEFLRPAAIADEGLGFPLAGLLAVAGVAPARRTSAAGVREPRTARTRPETGGPLVPHLSSDTLPRPEEVRAEVSELVRTRTAQGPMLLTLDPGEFTDTASITYFAQLARELSSVPVVLLVSVQEDLPDAHETWKRSLEGTPARFLRVSEEAGGSTLHHELRRRFEALPATARRATATVAIAGPDASLPVLRVALGGNEAKIAETLAPAVEAGLLRRVDAHYHLSDPAGKLEVEAALGQEELRSVHASVAKALLESSPKLEGKRIFRLAEHWSEAGIPERAVPAILASGTEASRRGAHEEAELEQRRALTLAQRIPGEEGRELEERALVEMALSQEMQGKTQAALDSYERAMRAARSGKLGVERWGPYLYKYARLAMADAQGGEGLEQRLKEALTEAQRANLPRVESLLGGTLAFRALYHGQREEAQALSVKALERAERSQDAATLARALRVRALSLFTGSESAGELQEVSAILQRVVEGTPAERVGPELAFALDDLASLLCTAHDETQALAYGRRSVEVARKVCSRTDLLLMLGNLSEHQIHAKDLAGATASLEEIRVRADRYGLAEGHSVRIQWMLAEGLRLELRGEHAQARQQLEATVALGERLGSRDMMSQALAYLVVNAVEHQEYDEARRNLRRIAREGLKRALFANVRDLLDAAAKKIPARGG